MAFLQGPTNFMNDMIYGTCSRPFYIYVTTAVPAFFDAWLLLRILLWDDIVRSRADYIGRGRGRTPDKPGHARKKKAKAIPQQKRVYSAANALKHLLIITDPLERIGLALLMYGAVDGFYRDWMWYLDDADACINPGFFTPEHRAVTDGVATPNDEGGAISISDLIQDNPSMFSNAFGSSVPLGRVQAMLAATIIGPGISGGTYRLRLQADGVLGSGQFESEAQFIAGGQSASFVVSADLFFPSPAGGQVRWELVGPAVPVGIQVVNADVLLQRRQTAFDV